MAGLSAPEENVLSCHECGASIYKEHLDKKLAGFLSGKLLCVHCLKEKKGPVAAKPPEETPSQPAAAPAAAGGVDDLPPISLVDELEMADAPTQRTSHGTTAGVPAAAVVEESAKYSRPLNKTGAGATRCRTFHAKLSDEAVRHMDQQIDEWCERNPDVEIKFSTSTVGLWTGKHAEPNLIITVFY